jgi:Arc/MetJ-type ribon-helix-helix transcriptional regulator
MARKVQTAVQFDADLLERIDKRIGTGRGSSRSEFVRQACDLMLALEERTGKWTAEAIIDAIDRMHREETRMAEEMHVTIYTADVTRDTLDHENVIREDRWEEQRDRYLAMLAASVREDYPNAEVDTEPGNGIDSIRVYLWPEDHAREEEVAGSIQQAWNAVFERWCETIPADAYRE